MIHLKPPVGPETEAGVVVDRIEGKVLVFVTKAGRGKDRVVVQGIKNMRRRGIQVKIGIENLTGLIVYVKGRE